MSLATGMTAEEFLARDDWPRGTQLIGGEVVVNEPKLPHQFALGRLHALLLAWTDAAPGRGVVGLSTDVVVTPADVYAPDIWWLPEERRPGPEALNLEGLPDLVVEVRSPSTWRHDVGRKRLMYEAGGVAELWLVDPFSRSVLVYRRSTPEAATFDVALEVGEEQALGSPLLPGFRVSVAHIFRR